MADNGNTPPFEDTSAPASMRTSTFIKASPETLYRAFTDPTALVVWLVPSSLSERTYFPRDSALGDRFEAKERATDALLPSRSVINRADKLLSDKLLACG